MTDLSLEREFNISADRLFDWISRDGKLVQWFGPEGMNVPESNLDFSRTGPWFAVMSNASMTVKVSGQVTHVDPPRSVGFTWGWHDDDGTRGSESHVTMTVVPTNSGARLVLTAAYQLQRTGGRYALCTMCVGVGQGASLALGKVEL